jgi:uncharacterized protein (TIGR02284 family)
MDRGSDISILNSLIKTTLDSVLGFEDAAEGAREDLATVFTRFAQERRQVVATLQDEVRRLGGEPEDDSSFLAAAHRAFMNLKEMVVARDDKAIVEEVERGEDYIKDKYETALHDQAVSPEMRATIQQAYASIREGHDQARALKQSMQNEA